MSPTGSPSSALLTTAGARAMVAAAVLALVSLSTPVGRAANAATLTATHDLDPAPSWQSAKEKGESGSWAKHSSPLIVDLDPGAGNGPEIVTGALDGKVYVMRFDGKSIRRLWTKSVDTFIDSSPAAADLDGDGNLEIVVGAGNGAHPATAGVHIWDHDGSNYKRWVIPGAPGVSNHVGVFSTPALGDVSGDGKPDVVFGSWNQKIYARSASGADLPGWEGGKQMHDTIWSSPALADVNGDGDLEIVIGTDLGGGDAVFGCPKPTRGMVVIFDGDGSFMPGWPKCMDTPIWSTPAVVDVTGDGVLDIFVGTNNYREGGVNVGSPGRVYAWDSSGRELWTTTIPNARIFASPAVGDVDGDGEHELAIGSIVDNDTGEMWLLDAKTGAKIWSRDDTNTGNCCIFMGSPILTDVSGDGRPDVVAVGGDGKLHAWAASGERITANTLGRLLFNSPAAGDLDGDGAIELVAASGPTVRENEPLRGAVYVLETQGSKLGPWPHFKRDAARLSAVGSGKPTGGGPAPAPPPPDDAAPVGTATPATSTPGASEPLGDPDTFSVPDEPDPASDEQSGSLAAIALALIAGGGGLAGLARRRRDASS